MSKKKRRFNREDRASVQKFVKKAIAVARAGIEIYFAAKRKDPIFLGLSLMSSYEALENILTKEGDTLHQRLLDNGLVQIVPGMEKLVYETLNELKVPSEYKMLEKTAFDEYSTIHFKVYGVDVYIAMEGGNYIRGIYAKSEEVFIEAFGKLLKEKLGDKVAINVYAENYNSVIKLSSIDIPLNTYICPVDEKEYCETIRKFGKMNLNRSSLLYGSPGSGKTSFSAKVADMLGGRLVVVDSQALQQAQNQGWNLVLQKILHLLSPTVILFDDIDRLENTGILLGMIENLNKFKNREIIIMASINDLTQLPEAMRRPGRFDEIMLFEKPDFERRKQILKTYLDFFGTRLADMYVEEMATLTEDLTPAYLREIALQATVASYDRIPKVIEHMKKMIGIECSREEDWGEMNEVGGSFAQGIPADKVFSEIKRKLGI